MKGPRPWDWLAVARKSTLLMRNRLLATSAGQAVGTAREESGEEAGGI